MAASQFIYYSSNDPDGPGPINGQTGSLIRILDACLVNGYTGKAAAGWTKPFPTLSSSVAAYTMPSGSQMSVLVNDSGWNATAAGRDAIAVGWETLTALTSSAGLILPMSLTGSHGNGFGQFPFVGQVNPQGHLSWRKSATADATPRNWFMLADAYSMNLFLISGDARVSSFNGLYHVCIFGDIFSLKGTSDIGRCFIYGANRENTDTWYGTGGQYGDMWDGMYIGTSTNAQQTRISTLAQPGHYMARSVSGYPGSVNVVKYGDNSRTSQYVTSVYDGNYYYWNGWGFNGNLPCPNGADQSIYVSPVLIGETNETLRGRLRGWYFLLHAPANVTDGQVFQGSGDYAGKTFQVVRYCGPFNNPMCIEISPTVETN